MHLKEFSYKESRIKVLTDKEELLGYAYKVLVKERAAIETYIGRNKLFLTSLKPIEVEGNAPKIVKDMAKAAKIAGVGPMAAVAGAISQAIAEKMAKKGAKVAVVENGGDIFAITEKDIVIGVFAGKNALSGKVALKIGKNESPVAICSSSSMMGHSLSFGKCDLGTVFSKSGSVADAAVTALCNRIKEKKDISPSLEWVFSLKGVDGALAVKDEEIGVIGEIPKIIRSRDEDIKEKVTKDDSIMTSFRF